MANEILKESSKIKKYLSKEFSLTFSNLVEQELEKKRKDGISYFEKDIYTKIGISKGAFNFYKNGNDGRGTEAKEKVPDLVGLYKIKNYFNVPYSYLLNETNTKDVNNLEIGMTLGLNDESISMLNKLNKDKSNVDSEFELYIVNCLLSNKKFIKDFSMVVIEGLSRKVVNDKFKEINYVYERDTKQLDYKKFMLANLVNSSIDGIINRNDIPVHMMESLKERPRHLSLSRVQHLEAEFEMVKEMQEKAKNKNNK